MALCAVRHYLRNRKDVDQATYALINDLKARGMLDSTLVIWGGEFWAHDLQSGWPHEGELRP
jgi:hypothetical protein